MSKTHLVSFGEAMIRYGPVELPSGINIPLPDAHTTVCLRSVGGDELNVCVAIARLDKTSTTWVSVLPSGPMGDVIANCAVDAGVDLSFTPRIPNAEVGTFTVIPELASVHFQRANSAFALQDPALFDWHKILTAHPRTWFHITGIAPMVSAKSRATWIRGVEQAHALSIPVSFDFNHRKQLGSLEDLWSITRPQLSRIQVLILSVGSMLELAHLEGVSSSEIPKEGSSLLDASWTRLMVVLRSLWSLKRLAVCFKDRDQNGLQCRWSVIADASGIHSTVDQPVFHKPKDECGGGSAWAAGLIDSFFESKIEDAATSSDPFAVVNSPAMVAAARRCDLLAALCQETIGDHSQVTRKQLSDIEVEYQGRSVNLEQLKNPTEDILESTLQGLKRAGIIAILRAQNADAAIARGIELCEMGCRAIEADWRRVLKTLVDRVPKSVIVGVGTVMDDTVPLLKEIAQLGGRFALAPINPKGFIAECHRHGILAGPSGLSSNEMWDLHRQGAKLIKMFHAGQASPSILQSILGVSPLKVLNIAPSGAVTPENAKDWWDAGAIVVGMGSNLAGSDISFPTGSEQYQKANAKWISSGKAVAKSLFDQVAARFQ